MKKLFTLLLVFICMKGYAQLSNGNMESWHPYTANGTSLTRPTAWYSADSLIFVYGPSVYPTDSFYQQLFQTTSSHGGSYAAKLVTRKQGKVGTYTGLLVNAQPGINLPALFTGDTADAFTYSGGTPISVRIQSVSAYVKYTPVGSDMGEIFAETVLSGRGAGGKDSVVGIGKFDFAAATTYTKVNTNITYNNPTVVPDKILIVFKSSANTPKDGSVLYVDDINMSTALAVPGVEKQNDLVSCYPNPSTGIVYLNDKSNDKLNISVYSVSGQRIINKAFAGNDMLNLSQYPDGMYLYTITDNTGQAIQHGKLLLSK